MSFKTDYPDFTAIEGQVRRARVERSLAIAQAIGTTLAAVSRFLARDEDREQERLAVQADAFLKRSVQ